MAINGLNTNGAIIGGIAGGGVGALAGGFGSKLFGNKQRPIDITGQLNAIQNTYAANRGLNQNLTGALAPLTGNYQTGLASNVAGAKNDLATQTGDYVTNTNANTQEAQDALRKNLYSNTFNALPSTLQAVREASAAGGGLNTGSYQKAVNDVGTRTAQTIGEGESQLQAQGAQARQGAQSQAFDAFSKLQSQLTDQQMQGLTKVLDTGREDLVRQYTTEMGLNEDETNAVVSLLNFQQSGQMAQDQASAANQTALLSALIGGGAQVAGRAAGAPVAH